MSAFGYRKASNCAEDRILIIAKREDEEKVIAKLYTRANKEAYNHYLEENFKMLVDLNEAANAIATTLDMYEALGKLRVETYNLVFEMFKPVVKSHLIYERVEEFLNGPNKEDWM
ncbi:hypothetical protein D3C75_333300 [compost metagenome]